MRTVNDFAQALEVLLGQAAVQFSADQLDAVGNILMALGGVAQGAAALKRAGGAASMLSAVGLGGVLGSPGPGPTQPVSGAAGRLTPTAPAPAPAPELAVTARYAPPPDDVQCEEAHHQRHDPQRIATLRGDPVVFCERVLYYLSQVGGVLNTIPADEPLRGQKIDELMLSIECLPGTRPGGGDEPAVRQVWDQAYQVLQDLLQRGPLDHDDAQQVLLKLGDRPGGAMRQPDYSNTDLRPPPVPGQVVVTQVHPDPAVAPSPSPAPPPATAGAGTPPLPGAPLPTGAVQFGKETIVPPADQGPIPTHPPQPSKPVSVQPGDTVLQPFQEMTVTAERDGAKIDLENQVNRTIVVSQALLEQLRAGELNGDVRIAPSSFADAEVPPA